MKGLRKDQMDQRWYSLPEPIRNISQDNAIVHDVLNRFVIGQIITKEEALCQVILALSTNWEKMRDDYIACKILSVQPLHIAP